MNAQRQWKSTYRAMKKQQTLGKMGNLELIAWLHELHHFRREAALERALEAERRKVERMQLDIQKLNEYLDSDSLEKARLRLIIHYAGLKQ